VLETQERDQSYASIASRRNFSRMSIAGAVGRGGAEQRQQPFYLRGIETPALTAEAELLFICRQNTALLWQQAFPIE
jgi:hypothetical protein